MATRTESIASIYATMSGKRASDITKSDLDHWVNLDSSISLEAINSSMVAMSGAVIYPTGTAAFVKSTFEAVFGYMPNDQAAGFAYWVNEINTGSVSRDTLSIALLKGAAPADEALATAKVAAAVSTFAAGQTILLTTAQDNLTGTAQNDTFNAYIFNNADTAQSGDMINGGAGTDRLNADMGTSSAFAVTLHTNSVEEFSVRAQADNATDSSQNNMTLTAVAAGSSDAVNIDAERMVGTNRYESNNSRADVVIEDVRIETNQITKDITIAMVQTDPGNVDMGVYFDQPSLRSAPTVAAGAGIDLKVMDIFNAADSGAFLMKNPYDKVIFTLADVSYTVAIEEQYIRGTYAQLLTGLNLAIQSTAGLETVTAAITGTFTGSDSRTNTTVNGGQTITLTTSDARVFGTSGWAASGVMPANSSFVALQSLNTGTASSFLITSTILLDDVGRGSQGGDLIVGGLSIGDTSTSKGVEQFDITVERNSKLQEISSTNNSLKEVYIVNGVTKGNLVVAGQVSGTTGDTSNLPASDANTSGFLDVRVVDASAMVGTVSIDAELSSNVVTKYMTLQDNATSSAADNTNFIYALGTNNDTLNLRISDANLAAAGTTSREDFVLRVSGGAGNDTITTTIETADTSVSVANFWYANSKDNANMSVDGGAGNDTIKTIGAGDMIITAGTGDDTVYTNNDGIIAGATRVNEVQTLKFSAAGDLNTNGQITVTLDNGTTCTTAGANLITTGMSASDVANKVFAQINTSLSAGVTASVLGDTVTLTYLSAYTDANTTNNGNVALATVSNKLATDATMTAGQVNGTANTGGAAAVTESATITFSGATATAGQTLIFTDDTAGLATKTITLVDSDNSGEVTAFEIANQVAAASFTNWNVTSVNASLGQITVAGKVAGVMVDFSELGTGTAAVTDTASLVTQGSAATLLVQGTSEVQTLTFTGADRTGTITLTAGATVYDIPISTNVADGSVATQVAAFLSGKPQFTSAVVGAAGSATENVIVTFASHADEAAITMMDGATIATTTVSEVTAGHKATAAAAATWVVNAANADIANLDSVTSTAKGMLYNATVTVTLSGALNASTGVTNGLAAAYTNGFESKVTIGNTNYLGNQTEVNQAIKAAINTDAVLSKLLVVNDGPANTLVITSLVDGKFVASDLEIKIAAPTTALTATELTALNTAYKTLMHDSTLASLDSTAMIAVINSNITAIDTASKYTTEKFGQSAGVDMAGTTSVSESDNKINLGAGNDVLVLGTDSNSNDTIVFTGSDIGKNTITNFVTTSVDTSGGTALDKLDFTSYLTSLQYHAGSTSTASQSHVANTVSADVQLSANEIAINNGFVATATKTWAGLDAASLLAAIKDTNTGTLDFANINKATLDIVTPSAGTMVSTEQHNIYMVENLANLGEYKVFDLTSTASTTVHEFTAATLLGTVDFGAQVTLITADFIA